MYEEGNSFVEVQTIMNKLFLSGVGSKFNTFAKWYWN